jgi:radical SAM superfamily enzyme YgiQ (UPF0313 family)
MEIVLIAPRHRAVNELPYKPLRKAIFSPLSLLTVAAVTPAPHRVRVLDEGVEGLPEDLEADLVGITATTAAAPRAYQIADQLRARGVRVVLGGLHVSMLPEEAAAHADAVVIGEGELIWPQVVADAAQGRLQKFYRSPRWPDLADLPAPRRDLIDPRRYVFANTTQTTRGCPFDCAYCSVTAFFGRTYRTRRIAEVVREVEEMPPGPVVFVDDNIMGNPGYARQLFGALRGCGRRWLSQASMTMLKTPELITAAARAGCRVLFVGLETLSQENLRGMGKRINVVRDYRELVNRLHDAGIAIMASFMFGLDDDDEGVFERTVEFARQAKIDAALLSILTPLPGTRLYAQMEQEGRLIDRRWEHYDGAHVTFRPRRMSPERLWEGLRQAYRELYSFPSVLTRALQPMGLSSVYWILNMVWRRYVYNWLEARGQPPQRPAKAQPVRG